MADKKTLTFNEESRWILRLLEESNRDIEDIARALGNSTLRDIGVKDAHARIGSAIQELSEVRRKLSEAMAKGEELFFDVNDDNFMNDVVIAIS